MKTLLLWALCCLTSVGTVQAQFAWQWAQALPAVRVIDVATDASGDVFVTGSFSSAVSFSSPAFSAILTPVGPSDIFLARFDGFGNVKWAQQVGGVGATAKGTALALDNAGSAYVVGDFSDASLTVNTGSDSLAFVPLFGSLTNFRACVLKYSTATGVVEWGRASAIIPGSRLCVPNDVAVGANGCFVVGNFGASVKFDNTVITGNRFGAAFVAAYSAAGALQWARPSGVVSGGVFPQARGASVATDAAGNCYVTGVYSNSDFELGGLTLPIITSKPTANASQAFVARLDPATGAAVWLRGNTTTDDLARSEGTSVSVATGGCYVGGNVVGTVTFGGSHTLAAAGSRGYLTRYDAATGSPHWVRPLPNATGPVRLASSVINVMAVSNVQPTGATASTVKMWSFWPWGMAQGNVSLNGGSSACSSVAQAGATVYLAGVHSGTVAFGPHHLTAPASASQNFLARFSPPLRGAPSAPSLAAFPNPATDDLQLVLPAGTQRVTLLDYFGRVVRQLNAPSLQTSLDVRQLRPGPYLLRCEGLDGASSLAVKIGQ